MRLCHSKIVDKSRDGSSHVSQIPLSVVPHLISRVALLQVQVTADLGEGQHLVLVRNSIALGDLRRDLDAVLLAKRSEGDNLLLDVQALLLDLAGGLVGPGAFGGSLLLGRFTSLFFFLFL